jgi:hypothetical protein
MRRIKNDHGGNRDHKGTSHQSKPIKRSFVIISLLSKLVKLIVSMISLFKLIRSLLS